MAHLGEHMTEAVKDASGLYEAERRTYHAARPGFRIAELQISPTQKVPLALSQQCQRHVLCVGRVNPHLSTRPEGGCSIDAGAVVCGTAQATTPGYECG